MAAPNPNNVKPLYKDKYYVYCLCKPDGTVFYVGKGKNNRINQHFQKWHLEKSYNKKNMTIRKYGKLREIPFESFAKAIQQTRATNSFPITPKNINYISEELGLPDRVPEDIKPDELKKLLGFEDDIQSKSGQGYSSKTGGLNGQSNSASSKDNSADNLANK